MQDESLHPQDFFSVRRGGLAHDGNTSKHVVYGTSWRRGGGVEKEPEEPCPGLGYASEARPPDLGYAGEVSPNNNGRDRALCNLHLLDPDRGLYGCDSRGSEGV